ncbi:MAG: hypothetical protein IJZ08_01970 [Clostridia bacterium]|nr:hypothetical protein [Clostridia bacterium]
MFGYIRPLVPQMLVCENELYRAIYCGLCRAMGKHTGCASRFTLSYDFVFLCAFRSAVERVSFTVEKHRCPVHPFKARAMANDNPVFTYAAGAAAILNAAKLADDAADESGRKRAAARLLSPAAKSIRKRAAGLDMLAESVQTRLTELSALESDGCASLDEPARVFGDLLGNIFAHGLTGNEERLSRTVGAAVGRFIYVADAADDAAEDAKSGTYNPILRLYADLDPASLFETKTVMDHTGRAHTKPRLRTDIAESIYTAALGDLIRLQNALELIDFSRCQKETAGIVKNTAYLGLPSELRRVLALPD